MHRTQTRNSTRRLAIFRPRRLAALALSALLLAAAGSARADDGAVRNVFQMQGRFPDHVRLRAALTRCISSGDYAKMWSVCTNAVAIFPRDAVWRYNLACSLARLGRVDEARDALALAAGLGFADPDGLAGDNDLAILRRDPVFAGVLAKVRENAANPEAVPGAAAPLPAVDVAWVTVTNTIWNMDAGGFVALFGPRAPSGAAAPTSTRIPGKTGERINAWLAEGTASGNAGDLYDNHDRAHSRLDTSIFTGIVPTRYAPEAVEAGVDTGFSLFGFPGRIVIGNSSTANVVGPFWGSCARHLQNEFAAVLLSQYLSNVLYVYPQHNDYLASKEGDVFPTRTPYLFISPGSSWTDRPILAAAATALAAMRPEVKDALARSGRIAPTLQYLLRASQTNVVERDDYATPAAHPVIFDGNAVDTLRLAELAHSIETNALPPLAPLRVVMDDSLRFHPGRDYPDPRGERLYDSPFAIARVWRAAPFSRHLSLEVAAPRDSALRYRWFVGQGDPSKVRIREIDSRGRRVEITVDYHDPGFETPFGVRSSRVDVVCVADDGVHFSPPSFITWFFPATERRAYDGRNRPLTIDYASCATNYVDPAFVIPMNFRDEFSYDEETGETTIRRFHSDGRIEQLQR